MHAPGICLLINLCAINKSARGEFLRMLFGFGTDSTGDDVADDDDGSTIIISGLFVMDYNRPCAINSDRNFSLNGEFL